MKAQVLQLTNTPNRSFSLRNEIIPNVNCRWHMHQEVELVHFHRGSGTQFVGDNISRFNPGDIVLVGSNLPHYWHFDAHSEDADGEMLPYATVVHFTENFWGEKFLLLPENTALRHILDRAKRGVALRGDLGQQIARLLARLDKEEGIYRLITLMECLVAASRADDSCLLASIGFRNEVPESENDRINAIHAYTLRHFNERIGLEDIAAVAGLSPHSFCRYFKSRTGKQYSQFLLEIRIGHSCRKLLNSNMSVKQICYESGFNNFTCFYKKFKRVTGKTPSSYKAAYVGG